MLLGMVDDDIKNKKNCRSAKPAGAETLKNKQKLNKTKYKKIVKIA